MTKYQLDLVRNISLPIARQGRGLELLTGTSLTTPVIPRLATTELPSIEHDGMTFSFYTDISLSTPMTVRVASFVNGWPVAISDRNFVVARSPSAADLQGDGRIGNGAMQDPFIDKTGGPGEQGFEAYIGEGSGGTGVSQTPYNDALNVRTVSITIGQETSIVTAPRVAGTIDDTTWQSIRAYPTLTVLAEAPFFDALPPAPSGLTKTMPRTSQIDFSVFRQITMPAGFPTLAEASANLPDYLGFFGNFQNNMESIRRFRLDVAIGNTDRNYSGHIVQGYMQACFSLLDDRYTQAEKEPLVYKIIGFGKQIDELFIRSGFDVIFLMSGAGQGMAWFPFWIAAGFALRDSAMLARAALATTQWSQCYWVDQTRIDDVVPVGNFTNLPQGWFQEMLGMPMMSPTGNDSNLDSRYGQIATGVLWEVLFACFLQNGPSGETGYEWVLQGGPDDNTNDRAAILGLMDRWRPIGAALTLYSPGPLWDALYDIFHTLGLRAKWLGVPDQPHLGTEVGYRGEPGDYFTPGDGQIAFDFSQTGEYSSLPILERRVARSLDGRHFFEETVPANTGTMNGLIRGQYYFCGYRLRNSAGWGPRSQNYVQHTPSDPADNPAWTTATAYTQGDRVYQDGLVYDCVTGHTSGTFATDLGSGLWSYSALRNYRNRVETTGTAANSAPVNTQAPKLLEKTLPNWNMDINNWSEIADQDILTEAGKVYCCGVGDWDCFPAVGFSFQWYLNGVLVDGETGPTYTAITDGDPLRCQLTPSNGIGSPVPIDVGNPNIVIPPVSSVQVVQSTTYSDLGPDGSHNLVLPGGIANGNLLVAAFRTAIAGVVPEVEPGWSLAASSTFLHVFTRVADGTEGGTTVEFTQEGAGGSSTCFGFAEISGATGNVTIAFSGSLTPPPIDPGGAPADTVFLVMASTQRTVFTATTPPPNYTGATPINAQSHAGSSTSGGHCSIGFAHRARANAGAQVPGNFGWTTVPTWNVAGVSIAVR